VWTIGLMSALAADGVSLRSVEWKGAAYTVVEIDLGQARIDLYGQLPPGPKTLDAVEDEVKAEHRSLVVAMNGGMYQPNRRPVGLHIERGSERAPIVRGGSKGNFGMLPNGVFVIDEEGAAVEDTVAWNRDSDDVWLATQSGPAMVLDGVIHPAFNPGSSNVNLRNGVGVRDPQHVVFVVSEEGVRLHDMATLFRDSLGCPNALYLDGLVSSLHGPGHEQTAATFGRFSGILAVTVPNAAPKPTPTQLAFFAQVQDALPFGACFGGRQGAGAIELLFTTDATGKPAELVTEPSVDAEVCLREAYLSSDIRVDVSSPTTFRYPVVVTRGR
jgi:uncharacterized protein YigE (DUF2233 family)